MKTEVLTIELRDTDLQTIQGFKLSLDVDAYLKRMLDQYGRTEGAEIDSIDYGTEAYIWNADEDEAIAVPLESLRTSIRERLEKAYRDLVLKQANESSKWQEEEREYEHPDA